MTKADDDDLERENAELRRRLAELEEKEATLSRPQPLTERDAIAAIQSRADSVCAMFGQRAPAPMSGERPDAFRRRILHELRRHSESFRDFDVARADDALLEIAEPEIYRAAEAAARRVDSAAPGILIPIVERDSAGRQVTRFNGDPLAWMAPFISGGQVVRITRP